MPLDERLTEQNDPNIDQIADLQRSITTALTYIMGLASVAELWGLQAYLSKLASQMAPVEAERFDHVEMPALLREQLIEMERQKRMQQASQQGWQQAQYRQES